MNSALFRHSWYSSIVLLGVCAQLAAAPGRLSDEPLNSALAPQPNIMLLLDDSGTMNYEVITTYGAQVVHSVTPDGSQSSSLNRERVETDVELLELCVGYNTLAYDPNKTYTPWPSVTDNTLASNQPFIFTDRTVQNSLTDPLLVQAFYSDDEENQTTIFSGGSQDVLGHLYIRWDDDDGDGDYDINECGPGVATYDSIAAENTHSMADQTVTSSSGIFYDSGGVAGNYSFNENVSITIDVAGGDSNGRLYLIVDSFNLDDTNSSGNKTDSTNADRLNVYTGVDTNSTTTDFVSVTAYDGSAFSSLSSPYGLYHGNANDWRSNRVHILVVPGHQAHLNFISDEIYARTGFVIRWQYFDPPFDNIQAGQGNNNALDANECGRNSQVTNNHCELVSEMTVAEQQNYANWYSYYRKRDFVAKANLGNLIAASDYRMGLVTMNDAGNGGSIIKDMSTSNPGFVVNRGNPDKDHLLRQLYLSRTVSQKPERDKDGNKTGGRTDGTDLLSLLNKTGQYFMGTLNDVAEERTYFGYDLSNNTPVSPTHNQTTDPYNYNKLLSSTSPLFNANSGGQCQQNFAIFITDGGYGNKELSDIGNEDNPAGTCDSCDNTMTVQTDSGTEQQTLVASSYRDSASGTLADVAMKYFKTDLSSALSNDYGLEQTLHGRSVNWQHMVTYGVGLGVVGSANTIDANGNALDPVTTSLTWPSSASFSVNEKIDDLLHATYNSRGQYFNAANYESLQNSLNNIIRDVNTRIARTSVGSAFSAFRFSSDLKRFNASYHSNGWWGDIEAYPFNADARQFDEDQREWSADEQMRVQYNIETDQDWFKSRQIITYNKTKGIPFDFDGSASHSALGSDTLSSEQVNDLLAFDTTLTDDTSKNSLIRNLVDYIKGDSTYETLGGTHLFRDRDDHYLGAFIHSQPQYVAAPDGAYPADIEGSEISSEDSYATFYSKYENRQPVIYAGSSDGMLHGFYAANSDQSGDTSLAGKELFAYIPHLVSDTSKGGNLISSFAKSEFNNTPVPYVDGQIDVADVFVTKTGDEGAAKKRWRTYLVGAMRSGGKGVYILDVTNPNNTSDDAHYPRLSAAATASNAKDIVVREFTHEDLHYVYGKPVIARMNNGRWAAIVANGYISTADTNNTGDGTAKLFVIYLDAEGGSTIIPTVDHTWSATPCTLQSGDILTLDTETDLCAISQATPVRFEFQKLNSDGSTSYEYTIKILSQGFYCHPDDTNIPTAPTGYGLSGCNRSDSPLNGLSSPTVVDNDQNGTADRVYAGDLLGNMWVFDISGNNESTATAWKVDSDVQDADGNDLTLPLITAKDSNGKVQPITVAPLVVPHPSALSTTSIDNLVFWGTGQLIASGDKTTTDRQSVYGVWDKGATDRNLDRDKLVSQTFSDTVAVSSEGETVYTRAGSTNPVDYTINYGWYIDLPDSDFEIENTTNYRERSIISPVAFGDTLVFATFIPNEGVCNAFSGVSYLNAVGLLNGSHKDDFWRGLSDTTSIRLLGAIVGLEKIGDDIAVTTDGGNSTLYQTGSGYSLPAGRQSWSILR